MNMIRTFQRTMHAERLPLWVNFSWSFVGNTVFSFSQWATLVVLVKLGSPELVGQFALANAITAPIFMFGSLDLATVQSSDVRGTRAFGDYLGLRFLLALLGMFLVAIISTLSEFSEELITITILVGLTRLAESISDATYGRFQKQERMDLVAYSLIFRGLVPLVTIAIALYVSHSLAVALITQIIVWSTCMFAYDLRNVRRWESTRPRFNPRVLISIFWVALPLGIITGLNSLSAQLPRYAMEHFGGQRELGIFSAIISLAVVAGLFTGSLSKSAISRLSYLYAQRAFDRFERVLFQMTGIGIVVGVVGILGAMLVGKTFLTIAYTEEYAGYTDVLIVTALNTGLMTAFAFLGTALSATRRFAVQTPIHVVKLTSIGVACLAFVPQWGAVGAAWATVVGSLVSGLAYAFILWRTLVRARRGALSEF